MDWAVSSQAGEEEVNLANGADAAGTPSLDEQIPSVEVRACRLEMLHRACCL